MFDLDKPLGQLYICTVLLLFLSVCLTLAVHVVRQRTPGPHAKMPWWAYFVAVIGIAYPDAKDLFPKLDGDWIVSRSISSIIVGIALFLGGIMAIMALIGAIISAISLVI
ncbi:MAG: hypothetical protein C0404_12660 [Verrucomicrobia bacterium]|nr:hypothetical protein [Verrucomicrobiota bacterium]